MPDNQDKSTLTEADFMRLLLQHENALRAFARSVLPDWDGVDDVIQDASVIMWQKLGRLDGEEGFLPWGKVIVRFHCYRYLEQRKRKGAVFSNELVAILADEAEQINEVEHSKRRQAMESCLGRLADPERDLVFARYLHHGRITELAEHGRTSANALYKKLGRLRDRLRNCVKERLANT